MPARIHAFHHVSLCVRDAAEAHRFYAEQLGLEEIPRPPGIPVAGAWYRVGQAELHVFEAEDFVPARSKTFPPHLALATQRFEETARALREAGVEFDFGPARGPDGVQRVVLRDPSGNVVEITEA